MVSEQQAKVRRTTETSYSTEFIPPRPFIRRLLSRLAVSADRRQERGSDAAVKGISVDSECHSSPRRGPTSCRGSYQPPSGQESRKVHTSLRVPHLPSSAMDRVRLERTSHRVDENGPWESLQSLCLQAALPIRVRQLRSANQLARHSSLEYGESIPLPRQYLPESGGPDAEMDFDEQSVPVANVHELDIEFYYSNSNRVSIPSSFYRSREYEQLLSREEVVRLVWPKFISDIDWDGLPLSNVDTLWGCVGLEADPGVFFDDGGGYAWDTFYYITQAIWLYFAHCRQGEVIENLDRLNPSSCEGMYQRREMLRHNGAGMKIHVHSLPHNFDVDTYWNYGSCSELIGTYDTGSHDYSFYRTVPCVQPCDAEQLELNEWLAVSQSDYRDQWMEPGPGPSNCAVQVLSPVSLGAYNVLGGFSRSNPAAGQCSFSSKVTGYADENEEEYGAIHIRADRIGNDGRSIDGILHVAHVLLGYLEKIRFEPRKNVALERRLRSFIEEICEFALYKVISHAGLCIHEIAHVYSHRYNGWDDLVCEYTTKTAFVETTCHYFGFKTWPRARTETEQGEGCGEQDLVYSQVYESHLKGKDGIKWRYLIRRVYCEPEADYFLMFTGWIEDE